MRTLMNNWLEVERRVCAKDSGEYGCFSCKNGMRVGDTIIKWRLRIDNNNRYLSAMFWTTQCKDCFNRTVENWSIELVNAGEMVNT